MSDKHANKHVNAVVVGAGAGGGVVAKVLAEAGLSVVLLERGRWQSFEDTTDDELRERIGDLRGADASGIEFLATDDQFATLRHDLARLAAHPLLPPDLKVGGFLFDVHSGALSAVEPS